LTEGIRFDHVSFAYPGTSRLVLDDVSLALPAGSVIAVVGENGAGKTTLVKLLAKMYEPTSGAIYVDEKPLARMPADEWRQRLAGAFQDFFRFEFHASHTVGVGDVPRVDDRPAVSTAVSRAGADDVVARLTEGLDTQLGPTWPGGVEVSFGQWQKLALARGFMRDQPLLLVLDEPTAALDAETEHALFERYASAARGHGHDPTGRIVVLVSHRFSTVRMADLIVVLDGAKLVEFGTHEQLMAQHGQTPSSTAFRPPLTGNRMKSGFDRVRRLARDLAGTEESTSWGSPSLKLRGRMFACMAVHSSAEPNTLVVCIPIEQRDELIAADPHTFYLTDHYVNYPSLPSRLSRVHDDALGDLLLAAWKFAADASRPKARPTARRTRR
jgi:ABC-type multidrug transport system ATPase subunit